MRENSTETVIADFVDPPVLDEDDIRDYKPVVPELPESMKEETANIVVPKLIAEQINAAPSGVDILSACIDAAVFLCQKNVAYGDSALNPVRIFSKANPVEQIKVRIDDKLSRLINGGEFVGDDDAKDLLGYLILLFVAEARNK